MDVLALLPALLAGLTAVGLAVGFWRLSCRATRGSTAHTEARSAQGTRSAVRRSVPAARPVASSPPPAEAAGIAQPAPAATPPSGPVAVLMTYTKADGSTSVRDLTIYSRNLRDGQTHSLNCRQAGEQITKQFLLSGISRLEGPRPGPSLVLSTAEEIAAWIERRIPERSSASRSSRPASKAVSSSTVQEPLQVKSPGALPACPPLPQQDTQRAEAPEQPAPLPDLLPDGAPGDRDP